MGGTHVAMADDFSTLFYNPAGFAGAKDELSVAEISMETVGPVFDIIDAVTEFLGPAGTLDISNLVGERGLTTGFDLGGPMAFGWIGRGLGFGFFNRTYVEAKAAGIQLNATAFEDIFLVGGYAFRLEPASGHTIDFGFAGKGFLRASGELGASVFSIETIIPDDPLGGIPISDRPASPKAVALIGSALPNPPRSAMRSWRRFLRPSAPSQQPCACAMRCGDSIVSVAGRT